MQEFDRQYAKKYGGDEGAFLERYNEGLRLENKPPTTLEELGLEGYQTERAIGEGFRPSDIIDYIPEWSGRKKAAVAAGVVLALGTVTGYVVPSALNGKWNPFQSSWWKGLHLPKFGGSTNKRAGRRRLHRQQQLLRGGTA